MCIYVGVSVGTEYEALQKKKKRSHKREDEAVRKGDGEGNSTHWKGEYWGGRAQWRRRSETGGDLGGSTKTGQV